METAEACERRNELARDLDRVESLRAVKDLQRRYAHLALRGAWEEIAGLFAVDGQIRCEGARVAGRAAVATWLASRAGTMDGKAPGSLHVELVDQPVAHLSPDGRRATARWMSMTFLGDGNGSARIEGGLYVNEYVRSAEGWRFSLMWYHPQYEGDYVDGWTNVSGADLPIIPFHFTSDNAGVPNPAADGKAPACVHTPEELASRIQRLNDEDAVRNLQNACGYYVDRRMWSDVVDLFVEDCAVQLGVHVHRGREGVRRALLAMGPEGLSDGELNDRPIFDVIVDVLPGGGEAFASGIELGLLAGAAHPNGRWAFTTFRNRFVKEAGLWKLKELCLTPLLEADYGTGWGRVPAAAATETPAQPLTGPAPMPSAPVQTELSELRRRLMRSAAYDGVENVSSAYGFYLERILIILGHSRMS